MDLNNFVTYHSKDKNTPVTVILQCYSDFKSGKIETNFNAQTRYYFKDQSEIFSSISKIL